MKYQFRLTNRYSNARWHRGCLCDVHSMRVEACLATGAKKLYFMKVSCGCIFYMYSSLPQPNAAFSHYQTGELGRRIFGGTLLHFRRKTLSEPIPGVREPLVKNYLLLASAMGERVLASLWSCCCRVRERLCNCQQCNAHAI